MVQNYPRVNDEKDPYYGLLDLSKLNPHAYKIPVNELRGLIAQAIENASFKSGREILEIPPEASKEQLSQIYRAKGKELFNYFHKYYGDPAATAYQVNGRHYQEVGIEQFRTQSLQKERMNSGWRYQFLATETARNSRRFISVSDIGAAEADFLAQMKIIGSTKVLNLYVSVKNRQNTLGGQDWPKAILALESVANTDKNRTGPYCCLFGIAMEGKTRAERRQPARAKDGQPYSANTEVWYSNFFWPFFSNYAFEEIMQEVLNVLFAAKQKKELPTLVEVPVELLERFGEECRSAGLINDQGIFHNPKKLVEFFCS